MLLIFAIPPCLPPCRHSLGAALAILGAAVQQVTNPGSVAAVYAMASPKIGDAAWADAYAGLGLSDLTYRWGGRGGDGGGAGFGLFGGHGWQKAGNQGSKCSSAPSPPLLLLLKAIRRSSSRSMQIHCWPRHNTSPPTWWQVWICPRWQTGDRPVRRVCGRGRGSSGWVGGG